MESVISVYIQVLIPTIQPCNCHFCIAASVWKYQKPLAEKQEGALEFLSIKYYSSPDPNSEHPSDCLWLTAEIPDRPAQIFVKPSKRRLKQCCSRDGLKHGERRFPKRRHKPQQKSYVTASGKKRTHAHTHTHAKDFPFRLLSLPLWKRAEADDKA